MATYPRDSDNNAEYGLSRSMDPKTALPHFRRFLDVESERLRVLHASGAGGMEVAAARAGIIDFVVAGGYDLALGSPTGADSGTLPEVAVVAVGGYGRSEMAPGSDIDLIFLFPKRASARCRQAIEPILYLLWDLNLQVGSAVRTVSECVDLARDDLATCNALVDARLVIGNHRVFSQLQDALRAKLWGRQHRLRSYLRLLVSSFESRHSASERHAFLSEPHLKDGWGGLRDFQTAIWATRARYGLSSVEEGLVAAGLNAEQVGLFRESYDFLLRLRHELHHVSGRKNDLLSLDLQPVVAQGLGFHPRVSPAGAEQLMRRYYEQADVNHRLSRVVLDNAASEGARISVRHWFERPRQIGRFGVTRRQLTFRDPAAFQPLDLVSAFRVFQQTGFELAPETRQLLASEACRMDPGFRSEAEVSAAFTEILQDRGRVGPVLRRMHQAGVLLRLLPELGRTAFVAERQGKQQWPALEHTLRSIEILDTLFGEEKRTGVFSQVWKADEVTAVYLSLLLYQVSVRSPHVPARVCGALGISHSVRSRIEFLLSEGGQMLELAERRDYTEPAVLADFVHRIKDRSGLNLVAVFSYSLGCAADPAGRHRSRLPYLSDLHLRATRFLQNRPLGPPSPGDVEDLVAGLSESSLTARFTDVPEGRCTELVVCTRDFPGLFARLAGCLAVHDLDIVGAELTSRPDSLAVDTIRLCHHHSGNPLPAERFEMVRRALRQSVEADYDLDQRVDTRLAREAAPRAVGVEPHVFFDFHTSQYTILEIRAAEQRALAYRIARCLASLDLDIRFARITTEGHHGLYVFYLERRDGGKLDQATAGPIKEALLRLLNSPC